LCLPKGGENKKLSFVKEHLTVYFEKSGSFEYIYIAYIKY
jgi:hypothetical protein